METNIGNSKVEMYIPPVSTMLGLEISGLSNNLNPLGEVIEGLPN